MSDEDTYYDDDEVSEDETAAQNRAAAERRKAEKAEKELLKEVEELRAFKAEREASDRKAAVSNVFQTLGLNPKHSQFYAGEEATEDAVKAWAVENEFLAAEEGEAPAPAPESGYTPTVVDGSSLGAKVYSMDDFLTLSQTDPNKANALWKAGRVEGAVRD